MRRSLLLMLLAVLGLLLPHAAHAITYGVPDDEHDYVGAFVGTMVDPTTGSPAMTQFCTGTVIAPRVVLTAAHCFVGLEEFGITNPKFTLAEVLDEDQDTNIDSDVTLLDGQPVPHEDFASRGLSNPFDVAVFLLDGDAGVTPAALAAAGFLDRADVQDDTFVAVGYGLRRESQRQATQSFRLTNRRLMVEQHLNSVTPAWATFSMNPATGNGGTCFGDSGGPHLHGDVVVSVTSIGDPLCKAIDKTYRVDTPWAREFLSRYVAVP